MKQKPKLSFWQIWNMSFGFLGIQFGWALQMANMGPIYEYLGADAHEIPMLFLAAPLTGMIIQPIIGYMSDRTWTRLGRRRPYFLVGAVLSSIALFFMPNSSTLWMAAGLLWILDASINISMEPFRAFVVDMLPEKQQSKGFAMQSFMIGLGSVIASALPWILTNWLSVKNDSNVEGIPDSVRYSFYIGALVFLGAVLYTIFTTKPYPPQDIEAFKNMKKNTSGAKNLFKEIIESIGSMPKKMKQISLVQFFTWPGLFLMWFYYSVAVAGNVFGAETGTIRYNEGVEFAGLTLSYYNLVTFLFALVLPYMAQKLSKRITHMVCLILGGIGLISIYWVSEPSLLFLSMTGVGIAWASILSMPYAMLASSLPKDKVGVYMGIFNFFIVLPEIIAAIGFGWIMEHILDNNKLLAVMIGGGLMVIAGILNLRISEDD